MHLTQFPAESCIRLLAAVCCLPPGRSNRYQAYLDWQADLTTRVRCGGAGRRDSWMGSEANRGTPRTRCEHFEGRVKWSKVLAVALPPIYSCRSAAAHYRLTYLQQAPCPRRLASPCLPERARVAVFSAREHVSCFPESSTRLCNVGSAQ